MPRSRSRPRIRLAASFRRRLSVSRTIAAPCDEVWGVLVDTTAWPRWGPMVRTVDPTVLAIRAGTRGHVRTALGLRLPFEITHVVAGRSWDWKVLSVPATGHRVEPVNAASCRASFDVPWWLAPYLAVCALALRRIDRAVTPRELAIRASRWGATTSVRGPQSMVAGTRIRLLDNRPERADGRWVVYWMLAARQLRATYGLDRAVALPEELRRPLIILDALASKRRCPRRGPSSARSSAAPSACLARSTRLQRSKNVVRYSSPTASSRSIEAIAAKHLGCASCW